MKRYDKLFITLDEEDMVKLRNDSPVAVMEGTDDMPLIIICTEKGYNDFLDHWGETDNES